MAFPNRYDSLCFRCGARVKAGAGVCVKQDGEWLVRHGGRTCPEIVEPPPQPVLTGEMTLIEGNTYPVRTELRDLGGTWDAAAKAWRVPIERAEEARALVAAAPAGPPKNSGFRFSRCKQCGARPNARGWPRIYRNGICSDCYRDAHDD